jgi:tRNA(Ser,Leu) C12 N-acetylase TAN1
VDDSIQEIELSGKTFAIRGSRESIERFAPLLEAKGMLVDLENPDLTLEIRKWGKKFLISVF